MPRRRPGTYLPLEFAILEAGLRLQGADGQFYGFLLARELQDDRGGGPLTAHGTLYKALARLSELGLVTASWEDPERAEAEGRPRRRLYQVTAEGEQVLAARPSPSPVQQLSTQVRPA
jgi:PadR family transcriptional regulator PadR